jgi:hypothetical protein
MALELPEDQLRGAMFDAAKLLARECISKLPSAGRVAIAERLGRARGARLMLVLDLGAEVGEVVALAEGERPLRAPLRR